MERKLWLLRHALAYTAAMAVALFVFIEFSWLLAGVFSLMIVSHVVMDFFKYHIDKKWKPFILDQTVHIIIIIAAWYLLRDNVEIRPSIVEFGYNHFDRINVFRINPLWNINPYWTVLGILVVMRPVGYLIKSHEIWDFGGMVEPHKPHAGRMIGYLERLIVFFLIINNAVATIGFVVTAKSIIRFSEINKGDDEIKKREQVEYFLIGTLLSLSCVFAVHLLLQLTHSGQTPVQSL